MNRPAPLVVVGDVLLDIDVEGRADRFSPDAPVPVVAVTRRRGRPGGAGLAALLAADESPRVTLIGGFGTDAGGERLRSLLSGRVDVAELPLRGSTVRKQRIRAFGQRNGAAAPGPAAVARVDDGDGRTGTDPLPDSARAALRGASAILVSDYGRGTAAHPEIRAILAERAGEVPIVWDPHPRGSVPVPGVAVATPNRAEAAEFVPGWPGFVNRARELARRWQASSVAVTLGAEGALYHRRGSTEVRSMPIPKPLWAATDADTCGAGDRFAAAAAVALLGGHGNAYAVRYAVEAAAEYVCAGAVSGSIGSRRQKELA
ncbi:PfkB family carbohydrate kinase [Nocardia sp. BMG51109]|uniref:PfkB family carbohydrate kinase n=1 Tax=Nocardia sp. BMG51109 TaxID=1056816 RepID=UPI0004BA57CA|nr:PfkB family carbohydrate kinase [Nocardia sp. BMG51109]